MAPEQVTHYDQVDGRTDIYALGAVAYYLLSGQPPFVGVSTMELFLAHASRAVPQFSEVGVNVPNDLESVVRRCLEKQPFDRYATAQLLGQDLRRCVCAKDWNAEVALVWWETNANL
jgi:serine/threonine-protein kinase